MNLLDQSLWWLLPFPLLMLVMLHAMMEFSVSLLVQRPPVKRKPISADQLRQRLLAANEADQLHQPIGGTDSDLELYWELEEGLPPGRLAIAKTASRSRLRLLLDEQRHELRINQVSHSYFLFFGFSGWLPRLRLFAGFQSGPPGLMLTKEFSQIAHQGGWTVRPVLWWFQATHRGYHRLKALTPPPFRRWPARRFWGILYPLTFALGIGYLVIIISPLDRRAIFLLLGVSAIWWGIWAFLVWILSDFPAFWSRGRH